MAVLGLASALDWDFREGASAIPTAAAPREAAEIHLL